MAETQHTHTQTEIWKSIPNYEGLYEVSSYGRVKSLERYVVRKGSTRHVRERILKQDSSRKGYRTVVLSKGGVAKRFFVHRIVLSTFSGLSLNGLHVDHKDNDPSNNYLSNLQALTPGKNNARQKLFGTSVSDRGRDGSHHGRKKTHCPRGHALVIPNLVPGKWKERGHRECLACSRARRRASVRTVDELQIASDKEYALIVASPDSPAANNSKP
ncbi:NUMOD4 domain-containing protein [Corynebacterium striatum]